MDLRQVAKNKMILVATLVLASTIAGSMPVVADDLGQGVPSPAALKTRMALKLAGLVAFVASSCPALKPDYARFKTAIGILGISTEDLEQKDRKTEYLGYALRYQQDVKVNCARARDDFGPSGKTVPDIFAAKEP